MTIDERLEKLAERHEALTQTVELMMAENRDREKANRDREQAVDRTMDQLMEGMARLLHIAEIHEQRIERLEGQ